MGRCPARKCDLSLAHNTPRVARLRKRQDIDSVVFKRAGLRTTDKEATGRIYKQIGERSNWARMHCASRAIVCLDVVKRRAVFVQVSNSRTNQADNRAAILHSGVSTAVEPFA